MSNTKLFTIIFLMVSTSIICQPFYPDSFNANDYPWRDHLDTSLVPSSVNENLKFWVYGFRLGDPAVVTNYIDQRSGINYFGALPTASGHPFVTYFFVIELNIDYLL